MSGESIRVSDYLLRHARAAYGDERLTQDQIVARLRDETGAEFQRVICRERWRSVRITHMRSCTGTAAWSVTEDPQSVDAERISRALTAARIYLDTKLTDQASVWVLVNRHDGYCSACRRTANARSVKLFIAWGHIIMVREYEL